MSCAVYHNAVNNAYLHEAALYIIGSFSIASHYIIRLKNNFLIELFETFSISSIHGGTETISYIRMCVRVAVRGIPLYSRNTARRHVCVYVRVYTRLPNQGDFA